MQEVSAATGVAETTIKDAYYKDLYKNRHKLAQHLPDWKDALEALPEH
jgi:hypothetical protein